jgi:hypothetical protein
MEMFLFAGVTALVLVILGGLTHGGSRSRR